MSQLYKFFQGSSNPIDTLTGNTGGAVGPTAGNINILGSGAISVAGNPGTSTLTISSSALTSISITGDTGGAQSGSAFTFTASGIGLSFAGASDIFTLGGTLDLANGGTSANLTASNGGIFYSTASAGAILAGTATAKQMLQSGASTTPAWSTSTWPATTTINQLLYSSANNVVGGVTAGDYGVLISSSTGVPSWLANGTTGQLLTATTSGTPSWENPAASSIAITGDSGGAQAGHAFAFTGGTTGLTFAGASETFTLGGTLVVSNGGTGDSSFTAYAPICGGTSTTGALQSASTGISNSGYVLTSTGSSTLPTWQAAAASGITTIDGDSGSMTGSTVTISGGSTGLTTTASSATMDLTGTLVVGNGGTGNTTFTAYSVITAGTTATGTFQNVVGVGTSGQVLTSQGASTLPHWASPAASSITITGDTGGGLTGNSFTFTGGTTGLSFGGSGTTETLSGTLKLANGGTNANLTASNGGIFYSTATAGAILAGTATANQVLLSGSSTTPAWSTATYPATTTINQLLYSSSNNVVGGVTAGDYGVLISSSSGVPSWLANGTTGQVLTATTSGTPSWASPASSSITITGDSGGGLTGTSFTFTGGSTGLTFAGSGTTETLGGTLAIANGGTDATSFTQSNGIVTYNGTRLVNYAGPQISSSGYMTNTTQPAFSYYNVNNISNVTGDGTAYTVNFDTKVFEQGSNFASSTFTAPVTGIYFFSATVSIYNLSVAFTNYTLQFIFSNGNSISKYCNPGSLGGGTFFIYSETITGITNLSATNTVYVNIFVAGGTKTVDLLGTAANTVFSGYLVC